MAAHPSATSHRRRPFSSAKLDELYQDPAQVTLSAFFLKSTREIDDVLFSDAPATPERWTYLQSWRRHLPDGTVLVVLRTGLGILVAIQLAYATLVCCYFALAVPRGAPSWPADVYRGGSAPLAIINLLTFALALLLVTRVQTVGARWTEARGAWGQIFNACRNVSRLLSTWLPGGVAATATAERWATALPMIARHHLRRHTADEQRPDLEALLTAGEVDWLLGPATHHTPTAAVAVLEAIVATASRDGADDTRSPPPDAPPPVPHEVVAAATAELSLYINSVGVCERLRGTNPPLAITRLTSRLLQTWLLLLPWCLWPAAQWSTVLLHGLLSLMLLSIENVAAQIEEPLHRLPLRMYAQALTADVVHVWRVARGAAEVASGAPPPSTDSVATIKGADSGPPPPLSTDSVAPSKGADSAV